MKNSNSRLAEFSQRLKSVRQAYGLAIGEPELSANKFAAELGVQRQTYGRWERGESEAPYDALTMIRRLTGVSLDRLVAGLPPGTNTVSTGTRAERKITFGMRLRWAREVMLPDLEEAAELMATPAELWEKYERDEADPPFPKVREFAHRFSVNLDFLYDGETRGLLSPVRRELVRKHPELGRTGGSGSKSSLNAGKPLQAKGLPRPLAIESNSDG